MEYSIIIILWLFIVYSFFAWIGETLFYAVNTKRFINRGLINGPFCVIYGFAGIFITIFLNDLNGIWLFIGCVVINSVVEWVGGNLGELLFHEKWWDYSQSKYSFDKYVSLKTSIVWGLLGVFTVKWGNGLFMRFYNLIPSIIINVFIIIILVIIIIDTIATIMVLSNRSKNLDKWKSADDFLDYVSEKMSHKIYNLINSRLKRAYPYKTKVKTVAANKNVFAYGCSFYKIIMIFLIGAFLGDIAETIFCRITSGIWMSRSSVVWGDFSVVWGIAMAAATLILYKYRNKSDRFLFILGVFLGGTFEYVCSVFTETFFGIVFWDYSNMPLNLGGRINLLYCFFWGFAVLIWLKFLYPLLSYIIEKIPMKIGKPLTWILICFMIINMFVSASALIRYNERAKGIIATNSYEDWLNNNFPDEKMKNIYPNALNIE